MNTIEVILVCADGTECIYEVDKKSPALDADVFIWNDTRVHPNPRHFVFGSGETNKRNWMKPVFKEVLAHYLPRDWALVNIGATKEAKLVLSWRDVYDSDKKMWGLMHLAREAAQHAGYKYYTWNGRVYRSDTCENAGVTEDVK